MCCLWRHYYFFLHSIGASFVRDVIVLIYNLKKDTLMESNIDYIDSAKLTYVFL